MSTTSTLSAQKETEFLLDSSQVKLIAIELASKKILEEDTAIYKSKIKNLELKVRATEEIVESMKKKEEAASVYVKALEIDYDEAIDAYESEAQEVIDLNQKIENRNKAIWISGGVGLIVGILLGR